MPDTPEVVDEGPRIALQRARERGRVEEWSLVLLSQGLHPTIRADAGRFVLSVPLEEAGLASAALAAYLHENPPPDDDEPLAHAPLERADADGTQTAIVVAAALLGFFFVTGPSQEDVSWFAKGSADASRLLSGEWWRSVTALTLHADLAHVLANSILGGILLGSLCALVGSGVACSLVLVGGALGNVLNAAIQASSHDSIGASTAVFAALGVLAALSTWQRRSAGLRGKRIWIPVAAGLGVLAMLGTGGQRVDLWAHLFGFIAGAVVGVAYAASPIGVPRGAVQRRLVLGCVALIAACWVLALR